MSRDSEKPRNPFVGTIGVPAKARTGQLLRASRKRYRLSHRAGSRTDQSVITGLTSRQLRELCILALPAEDGDCNARRNVGTTSAQDVANPNCGTSQTHRRDEHTAGRDARPVYKAGSLVHNEPMILT
jgi:hypothetical protein